MELPYLPPELINLVAQYAASSSGLRKAIGLRLVCRLFDNVVMHTIEKDRLFFVSDLEEIEGRGEDHESRVLFVARFLERRPYARNESYWAGNFSAVLNRILDTCDVKSPSDRIAGFKALLQLIHVHGTYRLTYRGIFTLVTWVIFQLDDERPEASKSEWETEIVPAAIVLKAPQVYDPFLPSPGASASGGASGNRISISRLRLRSEFFGTPLYAAIAAGAADIVRRILDYAPQIFLEIALEVLNNYSAAILTGRENIVHLLLQYDPPRDWRMESAIVLCAREGQFGSARAFLSYAMLGGEHGGFDTTWSLQAGLKRAYDNRDEDMIHLFLDHGAIPEPAESSSSDVST